MVNAYISKERADYHTYAVFAVAVSLLSEPRTGFGMPGYVYTLMVIEIRPF
jgi:hypothetical protein